MQLPATAAFGLAQDYIVATGDEPGGPSPVLIVEGVTADGATVQPCMLPLDAVGVVSPTRWAPHVTALVTALLDGPTSKFDQLASLGVHVLSQVLFVGQASYSDPTSPGLSMCVLIVRYASGCAPVHYLCVPQSAFGANSPGRPVFHGPYAGESLLSVGHVPGVSSLHSPSRMQ
jgi:hypothetical protein